MIPYPKISPDIIRLGDSIAIRWYSMMYLLGYVIGYKIIKKRVERGVFRVPHSALDPLITYFVVGMLLGARFFYVVFYNLGYYAEFPLEAFMIWKGGLSFHGAAVGMVAACWFYGRKFKVNFFEVTDSLAIAAGPGLFLGRIGNFINGELYGRATDVPWAMIFPSDETGLPRHPSQLYQGLTEGLLLWLILMFVHTSMLKKKSYKVGLVGALFLIGYGLFRFLIEFTREPDAQLGLFFGWLSMGQILCIAMMLAGAFVLKVIKSIKPIKL
jgi:phosphatidylglycerol:prolipoprotein diacylglycerol transferase